MYGPLGYAESFKFIGYALGLMLCGAQAVHAYYKPMSQIDELVAIELERLRREAKAEKK